MSSDATVRISTCPICGAKEHKILKGFSEFPLAKCRKCSNAFSVTRPSEKELIQYYSGYPLNSEINTATRNRYEEFSDMAGSYRNTGNILEIGCGEGFLLEHLKMKGWNVFGTEFGPHLVEICRSKGITMHEGEISKETFTIQFDIIFCIEVIEHVSSPETLLSKMKQLVRKGGAIYITTPNFNSISRNILGSSWRVINYPEHLNYFNPGGLDFILQRFGFRNFSLATTGISIEQIRNIFRKKMESDHQLNELHRIQEYIEANPVRRMLKKAVNKMLSITGKGDTIKALYISP